MEFPLISVITFLPLVTGVLLLGTDRENHCVLWGIALAGSLLTLLACVPLWTGFVPGAPGFQFVEDVPWIPSVGIGYKLGVDGLSLALIILTTLLTPLCILASTKEIQGRVKEFLACMMFLETGMIGVFASLDLFLFYVFWEVMLIPMALLIGIWGSERRIYAAVKFVLYTMAGSVFMLIAILALFLLCGGQSFDYVKLAEAARTLPLETQKWIFLGFALSFAIKVPVFPLHTWLPDAHVEAPTAGSMILAGVLLKMGTYGLARFCIGIFPEMAVQFSSFFCILGIIGIIYGALVCMVQPNVKKLIAYSSVSHMGFIVLGLFALNAQAMSGAFIQMLSHGLSTGALFFLVGILYDRRHTKMIDDFGGLAKSVPRLYGVFLLVMLSSVGLPGLSGFVGEFMILVGTFKTSAWFATLAATGVILAAIYMLWMFQRVFLGPITNEANAKIADLDLREFIVLAPMLAGIFFIGIYPKPILQVMNGTVNELVKLVSP